MNTFCNEIFCSCDIEQPEECKSQEQISQNRKSIYSEESIFLENKSSSEYPKLSYHDVRREINNLYYQDTVHRYSSALDILASYLHP
tara:strand:- start:6314 stop:6574 length:261 start_codon:yes stop_codon:yes gene_type:complete